VTTNRCLQADTTALLHEYLDVLRRNRARLLDTYGKVAKSVQAFRTVQMTGDYAAQVEVAMGFAATCIAWMDDYEKGQNDAR